MDANEVSRPIEEDQLPLIQVKPAYYKPDRFRICNLVLFILLSGCSELSFYGFSLVATQIQQYWYASAFLAATLVLSFPATLVITSCSVKIGLAVGVALCLMGSWLRVGIGSSFYLAFVGQYLIGGSYAFFRNTITQISAHWFVPSNRALSTSLFCLANNLLTSLSLYLPTLPINVNTIPHGEEQHYCQRLTSFFIINAALVSVVGLLALAFYRQRPQVPVSLSSEQIRVKPKHSFRAFFSSASNVFVVLGSSLNVASCVSYAIMMQSGLQQLGVTTSSLTPYVLLAIPGAIIVSIPISVLAGRIANFKALMVSLNLLALLALIGNLALIHFKQSYFLGPSFLILTISANTVQALSYEVLSEISYPISQAFTAGLFLFAFKVFSIALVQLCSLLLAHSHPVTMLWLIMSIQALSTFFTLLFKENLNRRKAESIGAPPSSMSLRLK